MATTRRKTTTARKAAPTHTPYDAVRTISAEEELRKPKTPNKGEYFVIIDSEESSSDTTLCVIDCEVFYSAEDAIADAVKVRDQYETDLRVCRLVPVAIVTE